MIKAQTNAAYDTYIQKYVNVTEHLPIIQLSSQITHVTFIEDISTLIEVREKIKR